MVKPVRLSGVVEQREFESIIAVDETGVHTNQIPTVVAASFINRSQSEKVVKQLIDADIQPWFNKSADLDLDTVYDFFHEATIYTAARATQNPHNSSQRGLMAIEAAKEVIQVAKNEIQGNQDCLILLDGKASNYGGEKNLLRSHEEILDSYFQQQNGVNISLATIQHGDRRYPEITVADCACNIIRNKIESEQIIENLEHVQRFDVSRSVPSVEFNGSVYRLAPKGVQQTDEFESKVAAWIEGKRPHAEKMGDISAGQLQRIITQEIDDDDICRYISEMSNQLGSQQA